MFRPALPLFIHCSSARRAFNSMVSFSTVAFSSSSLSDLSTPCPCLVETLLTVFRFGVPGKGGSILGVSAVDLFDVGDGRLVELGIILEEASTRGCIGNEVEFV